MKALRKLNFWKLLWTRRKYHSFYEMFNKLSLEPEERKSIQKSILRTFVQTTLIFCVIGIGVWVWYYIKPDSYAVKVIMVGTPIAIVILSLIGYISRQMLKDFAAYSERLKTLTNGGGMSEGIMYDIFGFD